MKTGFVGIIGRPNVGKSTLLNAILGEKIAITTEKPQTTRNAIRGIYTHYSDDELPEDLQMIFIDTPGIHRPRTKLGSYMTDAAIGTLKEVDAIIFIVDDKLSDGPGDKYIVDLLDDVVTPKILVINKIDKMQPDEFAEIYKEYEELGLFEEIIGVSAKEGTHVENVIKEIIREKILMYLQDEVPHGVAVEIEQYKEEEKITKIHAVIYCEKKSHKGMIIGKGGRKLKGIGKSALEEIEVLLGTKVYLELWVKVKENWRDSDVALSNFGYKE